MAASVKALLAPSILSADFGHLSADIALLQESEADWYHVDVMDGVFVPNISFGFPVMEVLQKEAKKPLDVHLMIVNPERYVDEFAKRGAYMITVHYEAVTHLDRVVQQIKQAGCKVGVALNPHTSVGLLENIWHELDLILVMSVNPGFGGQQFIPQSIEKVKQLNEVRKTTGCKFLIEVDGGVNLQNAADLVAAGADVLVAGSAVFQASDVKQRIADFKKII